MMNSFLFGNGNPDYHRPFTPENLCMLDESQHHVGGLPSAFRIKGDFPAETTDGTAHHRAPSKCILQRLSLRGTKSQNGASLRHRGERECGRGYKAEQVQ